MATTKKPQDHQAKQQKEIKFSEVEGNELLKPLSEVDLEAGLGLVEKLESMFDGDSDSVDEKNVSVREIIALARAIREGDFVEDAEGFARFMKFDNAQKALHLVMAYVQELGKGLNSNAGSTNDPTR